LFIFCSSVGCSKASPALAKGKAVSEGMETALGGSWEDPRLRRRGDTEAGSWRELLRLIGVAEAMEIS
jgi:hypothetical protein